MGKLFGAYVGCSAPPLLVLGDGLFGCYPGEGSADFVATLKCSSGQVRAREQDVVVDNVELSVEPAEVFHVPFSPKDIYRGTVNVPFVSVREDANGIFGEIVPPLPTKDASDRFDCADRKSV